MRRIIHRSFALLVAFAALSAVSAQAQTWTSVASGGVTIHHNDTANYSISNGALFFKGSTTGNVRGEYNIVNPKDTGNPSWTTLSLVANGGPGGFGVGASATLYRQSKTTGTATSICTAVAPSTGVTSTSTCTFASNTFDFVNNNYVVALSLGRTSSGQSVTAYSLRVF